MGVVVDARSERLSGLYENYFETGIGENIAGNPPTGAAAYYTDVEDWFAHVTLESWSGDIPASRIFLQFRQSQQARLSGSGSFCEPFS